MTIKESENSYSHRNFLEVYDKKMPNFSVKWICSLKKLFWSNKGESKTIKEFKII